MPCWDLGREVWFTTEWLETGSAEDFQCYEPMMDKKLRYSQAEILESGDARARIHWHYALSNIGYEIFNGNTAADEYYTVYPDGIAVRKLVGWPGNESDFGGTQRSGRLGNGYPSTAKERPPAENLMKETAFTLQDLKGDEVKIEWPMPQPFRALCKDHPEIADWDAYIGRVHLKGRPDLFVVVRARTSPT